MNPTSKIVALASAISFVIQIALALLMLRYFSPEEVGTFSVISQIGFFWTTLALAQAPLQILANHGVSVLDDARLVWAASMKRFIWLMPIAAIAVWWSGMSFVSTLIWALLLSLCQIAWMLAQSMRLRMASVWAQAGVRVLPPFIALLATSMAIYYQWSGLVLLTAALLGYAFGATWLFPAFFKLSHSNYGYISAGSHAEASTVSGISTATDDRSTTLRMVHTFFDALLATAIVVVWQRLYGAQETGWMTAPLRVMGFVPAVVHMAWAQVHLAKPKYPRTKPCWAGLFGFVIVAILGASCNIALEMNWLGQECKGVEPYLLPLAIWQGSSCLVAGLSSRPFETKHARNYSLVCIGVVSLQVFVLLAPISFSLSLSHSNHFSWLGGVSAICFFTVFLWLKQLN